DRETPSLRLKRRQFAGQRMGPLGNRAGAEADDVVAWSHGRRDDRRELVWSVERDDVAAAMRAQARSQCVAIDAGDRRLTRRLDPGDDYGVGIIETAAELVDHSPEP